MLSRYELVIPCLCLCVVLFCIARCERIWSSRLHELGAMAATLNNIHVNFSLFPPLKRRFHHGILDDVFLSNSARSHDEHSQDGSRGGFLRLALSLSQASQAARTEAGRGNAVTQDPKLTLKRTTPTRLASDGLTRRMTNR